MKRRILVTILIVVLCGLGIFGGVYLYNRYQDKQDSSNEDISDNSTGDNSTTNSTESQPKQPINTSMIFTGDVLLSEYVLSNYNNGGIDKVVSSPLRDKMVNADFTMVNNEFPFSNRGTKAPDKQYTFRVDPKYVTVLQELGIDAVGLANNHVLDFGKEALEDTFTTLNSVGIPFTGAGHDLAEASKIVPFEKDGVKVGIVAATRVIPVVEWNVKNSQPGVFTTYDPTDLINVIQRERSNFDLIFVMVHWGTEHTDKLEEYQKTIGHQLIDAGADCIIGAHPHVVQGIEKYNGKMIFYSLGNYIFNQNIERTFALNINYDNVTVNPMYSLIPARASNATTREMTAEEAASLYSYLNSISTGVTIDDGGNLN